MSCGQLEVEVDGAVEGGWVGPGWVAWEAGVGGVEVNVDAWDLPGFGVEVGVFGGGGQGEDGWEERTG